MDGELSIECGGMKIAQIAFGTLKSDLLMIQLYSINASMKFILVNSLGKCGLLKE